MNPAQLLEHFDRISEAPDAVARLRRFILDLAVRGKLVEQDSNDEPASELLKQIQAEKARLVKEGSLKKVKLTLPIRGDEQPFSTPVQWQFVRLGDVLEMINGRAFKPTDWLDRGLPIVRIQNLNNVQAPFNYCNPETIDDRHLVRDDEFLISWSGTPGTSFGAFIWKRGLAALNQHIFRCIQIGDAFWPDFLRLAINSQLDVLISKAQGGVGLQHVTKGTLEALPLPLPPLAEQHRIVAKVDELMALCLQLEAAKNEREARRDRLVAASLNRIGTAPAAADEAATDAQRATPFRDAARFHVDHLPGLTTRPEHIKQLRQTILNLAVRGRLVPQDPNDEPAAELLKLIDSNKARFVKAGVIRNVTALAELVPNEEPFPISNGWLWVRLGSVGYTQTGTTPPTSKPECFGGDTPFVTPSDLSGIITTYEGKGLTDVGVRHSRLIQKNSVLMVCIGSTIGKTNVVDRDVCCNQQINTVTPFVEGMTSYFAIALRSAYFQGLVFAKAGMGTLPILSKGKWELLPIPLPPLAEQQRIVAKVDELMALCDQLESRLTATQTDSRRLLEAVLHEALAPALEKAA